MARRSAAARSRRGLLAGVVSAGLILAGGALRAEVTVRSGEHPGHSRLVLEFETLPSWRLEPRPGGYALRFGSPQPEIRLDRVFYFIPRTRLADLRVAPGNVGLDLDLGCPCEVEASVARNRALVIDILDADPAASDTIAAMTDGPVILLTGTRADRPPDAPEGDPGPNFSPVPQPARPEAPLLPFTGTPPSDLPYGSSLTRALAEELARAASQGMVNANREILRTARDSEADRNAAVAAGSLPASEPSAAANIRFRSGFDRATDNLEDLLPNLPPELSCPDPRLYAVAAWTDGRPAQLQIGTLRSALVGEFDRVDRASARKLARLYLHLTFGTEARAVVREFLPDDPAAATLIPLSRLIERAETGVGLAGFGDCDGSLPLWAILDENPDEPPRSVKIEAALLAFSGLPAHLRKHLGYRLAGRLAARGDFESAEIVRATIERIAGPDDPALVLSSVHATDVEGVSEETKAALQSLALSLRPEAAEALLLNIDGRLTRGERIPVDLIETAAAISFELAGSEEGRRVKVAEIRARFANGEFASGFEELHAAAASTHLDGKLARTLLQVGLEALLRQGSDAEFVRHMFAAETAAGLEAIPAELRLSLAERLLAQGFPERAAEIVPDGPAGSKGFLEARLAQALGDVERAISLLERQSDPQARRLLADLLLDAGRFDEAHAVYAALDDPGARREAAWRAGLWSAVSREEWDGRAPAADAMLSVLEPRTAGEPAEPRDTPPTIEGSTTLLEQSSNLRDVLGSLLENVPRPDG